MVAGPALALLCLPRDAWVERLKDRFGEEPVAHGLALDGRLMELFTTPDGATWTLVITGPNGISCGFASGENWRRVAPKLLNPTELPA